MFFKRLGIAAGVIIGMGATGVGLAVGQSPGVAGGRGPAAPSPAGLRLPPAAAAMYKYLKLREPNELKWQQIPWLTDLPEAVRQAKAENRPLLFWLSDDDPLDRC